METAAKGADMAAEVAGAGGGRAWRCREPEAGPAVEVFGGSEGHRRMRLEQGELATQLSRGGGSLWRRWEEVGNSN